MKCICGNPMRLHIVALDDEWWICMICGREKPATPEPAATEQNQSPPRAHVAVPRASAPQGSPTAPTWIGHAKAIKKTITTTPESPNERSDTMSNNLEGLNDVLFKQLASLTDQSLTGEALKAKIEQTKAVSNIARDIIANSQLALEVQRTLGGKTKPGMLAIGNE